jgi:hypothetical protein
MHHWFDCRVRVVATSRSVAMCMNHDYSTDTSMYLQRFSGINLQILILVGLELKGGIGVGRKGKLELVLTLGQLDLEERFRLNTEGR